MNTMIVTTEGVTSVYKIHPQEPEISYADAYKRIVKRGTKKLRFLMVHTEKGLVLIGIDVIRKSVVEFS